MEKLSNIEKQVVHIMTKGFYGALYIFQHTSQKLWKPFSLIHVESEAVLPQFSYTAHTHNIFPYEYE